MAGAAAGAGRAPGGGEARGSVVFRAPAASDASRSLAASSGVREITARCLIARGITDPVAAGRYLRPRLDEGLRSPNLMRDLPEAARRLRRALASGERVGVYADYDVDGATAGAILLLGLRELGADPFLFVPDRLRHGYGLCREGIDEIVAAGCRLMVTADCGGASHAEIAYAASRGLEVIVCDHHIVPDERPPALAVLNPRQPGCTFPFQGLCGAGVAFYLLLGLRTELRADATAALPDLRRYLDLVALGTIADDVPLREENRVLVAHGLRRLGDSAWPGLRALLRAAAVDEVSVGAVSFRLAPRLNASGRVASGRTSVELLAAREPAAIEGLIQAVEAANQLRREIEAGVVEEAVAAARALLEQRPRPLLVVAGEGWHPGVVGIVAARLVDRFRLPAIVLGCDAGVARGSGRSHGGLDLLGAVSRCGHLLARFGGHREALGLTLDSARVGEFRAALEDVVATQSATRQADHPTVIECDAAVRGVDLDRGLAQELAGLQPCGAGNPEPGLIVQDGEVRRVRTVGQGHLALDLDVQGVGLGAIAFSPSSPAPEVGARIDVAGALEIDRYRGLDTPRLRVRAWAPAQRRPA